MHKEIMHGENSLGIAGKSFGTPIALQSVRQKFRTSRHGLLTIPAREGTQNAGLTVINIVGLHIHLDFRVRLT
jgi:hypothetical protein